MGYEPDLNEPVKEKKENIKIKTAYYQNNKKKPDTVVSDNIVIKKETCPLQSTEDGI